MRRLRLGILVRSREGSLFVGGGGLVMLMLNNRRLLLMSFGRGELFFGVLVRMGSVGFGGGGGVGFSLRKKLS